MAINYDKLSKIIYGMKIANAYMDSNGKIDANVILSGLLDRRQNNENSFPSSIDSLVYLYYPDYPSLASRTIYFFNSGRNQLAGYYYEVPNAKGIVIYVHGIGSYADDWYTIGQDYFVRNGFSVFAIDLTSCGRSQGIGIKGLAQSALDTKNAVKFVKEHINKDNYPIFLFGHSWGGYGVAASLAFESVDAVASLSGFATPLEEMREVPENFVGQFIDFDNNAKFNFNEVEEAAKERWPQYYNLSAVDGINSCNVPVLIVQGGKDKIVTPNGSSLYAHKDIIRKEDVEYMFLPNDDHLSLFRCQESNQYKEYVQSIRNDFEKVYGKNLSKIPPECVKQFTSQFDRRLTSIVNENLFDSIANFFEIHSK